LTDLLGEAFRRFQIIHPKGYLATGIGHHGASLGVGLPKLIGVLEYQNHFAVGGNVSRGRFYGLQIAQSRRLIEQEQCGVSGCLNVLGSPQRGVEGAPHDYPHERAVLEKLFNGGAKIEGLGIGGEALKVKIG